MAGSRGLGLVAYGPCGGVAWEVTDNHSGWHIRGPDLVRQHSGLSSGHTEIIHTEVILKEFGVCVCDVLGSYWGRMLAQKAKQGTGINLMVILHSV